MKGAGDTGLSEKVENTSYSTSSATRNTSSWVAKAISKSSW